MCTQLSQTGRELCIVFKAGLACPRRQTQGPSVCMRLLLFAAEEGALKLHSPSGDSCVSNLLEPWLPQLQTQEAISAERNAGMHTRSKVMRLTRHAAAANDRAFHPPS